MTECFQQISLGFHDLPQAAYDYAEAKGTLYSATELANSIRMPFELPRNRSLALCLKELLEAVEDLLSNRAEMAALNLPRHQQNIVWTLL